MSSHADTIRRIVNQAYYSGFSEKERDESLAALDALLAENERAIEALQFIDRIVNSDSTLRWKVEQVQIIAREALAGDTE